MESAVDEEWRHLVWHVSHSGGNTACQVLKHHGIASSKLCDAFFPCTRQKKKKKKSAACVPKGASLPPPPPSSTDVQPRPRRQHVAPRVPSVLPKTMQLKRENNGHRLTLRGAKCV